MTSLSSQIKFEVIYFVITDRGRFFMNRERRALPPIILLHRPDLTNYTQVWFSANRFYFLQTREEPHHDERFNFHISCNISNPNRYSGASNGQLFLFIWRWLLFSDSLVSFRSISQHPVRVRLQNPSSYLLFSNYSQLQNIIEMCFFSWRPPVGI